jgi:hypothetical protein
MRWHGPSWLRDPLLDYLESPIFYRVEELDLGGTPNGDEIVEKLAQLPHLKRVDISRTRVTPNGVQRIKQMFPRAAVEFEPREAATPEMESAAGSWN